MMCNTHHQQFLAEFGWDTFLAPVSADNIPTRRSRQHHNIFISQDQLRFTQIV